MRRFLIAVACAMVTMAPAHAATIFSVSPQGEVAQVRQVTVKFSEAVVPFGDLRLPDPMAVQCQGEPGGQGAAPSGAGRWANDRTWLYDFKDALPPGTRCTLKARAAWKPSAGALTGRTDFAFSTGGPAVVQMQPYDGSTIDEDQHFLLRLNGPAVDASVTTNVWCEVQGIGERLPVRIVTGKERDELLKARRVDKAAAKAPAQWQVLACQRPLPPDVAVRLVWGKGIAALANPRVATSVEQVFKYQVRKAFTAEFSCERERAGAPCWPVLSTSLNFSAPVPRALAEQVRLRVVGGVGAGAGAGAGAAAGTGATSGTVFAPVIDKTDKSEDLQSLSFPRPLPENATLSLALPANFKDNAGRPLANAQAFPLQVKTAEAPPIAKFATAPFGVIERHAEAMLPVTLRHVQGDLRAGSDGSKRNGSVRVLRLQTDADIVAWYGRVRALDGDFDARNRSLLADQKDARRLDLPQLLPPKQGGTQTDAPRPFEVIGLPLPEPGYHVVEIESRRLGEALLDPKAPMFVRTGVLVTNLGVHFKRGRENALVWVTTLDRARPVEGADVAISDCQGQRLWAGRTDAQGLARVPQALAQRDDCGNRGGSGEGEEGDGTSSDGALFVSARKADANGVLDTAFVFGGWQKGIEPWRFNVPTSSSAEPDARAHTVFDRSLLRAGETLSMKHFIRAETSVGLALLKPDDLPTQLKLVHQGSGQAFTQPLQWSSPRSATSSWNIPAAAKLGVYDVLLVRGKPDDANHRTWTSGNVRVEEFRVPLVDARLTAPKAVPVAPKELAVALQLNYLSGGPMAQAPVRVSALLKSRSPDFAGFDEFSFEPPREAGPAQESEEGEERGDDGKLVADKIALTTDRSGAATVALKDLPRIARPSELLAEVTFNDPNGEAQTVGTRIALWPASVVLGIKASSWASNQGKVKFTALALDTTGKPVKGQRVDVRGQTHQVISTRKRMVGGFYAYDNRTEVKEIGSLCNGATDERGLLLCEAELTAPGEVQLIVRGTDAQGNTTQAATSVWVTKQGELWFAQDNDDRIDVLPEKKRYEVGETAKLQVRSPFREATALVAVEREGIVQTQLVTLRGDDPTVRVKIEPGWGPNVYVSVLALRGRIRDVPWYSFFTWGWKEPLDWVRSFMHEGREYRAPTATVDLSKPAFKLGVAALSIGLAEHELQVSVSTDKPQYAVRQKAVARIKVVSAGKEGGKPVAGTEVAFAAVDEGLLALRNNDSWQLLTEMIQARAWGVETSTAQSEIIGRRHYGRKAIAAGGGGGRGATRELFDTLLLWKATVVLDANGEATVEVPLNDSLTSFRLVAVADAGAQRFGTGSTTIRVTQDLQLLAGLPPLVREGDRFSAMLTLRNTTARDMNVRVGLQGTVNSGGSGSGGSGSAGAGAGNAGTEITRTPLALPPQDVALPAGAAKEVAWPADVPADAFSVTWEASVEEQVGTSPERASDRVRLTQLVSSAVPVRVMQATLQQLDGSVMLPVAAPADALSAGGAGTVKRGGVHVALQPKLSGALPGMRRYFETYPFVCLEQKTSKAVGLADGALWSAVANQLPTYLDSDGLANYFPPRAEDGPRGSDRLTAYVLAATHEAKFELPPAARDAMLAGLSAFVEGRIERKFWSPRADLDVRKLAAIEALSRYGRAQPRMLGSVNLTPNLWPTAAVIDWLNILRRVNGIAQQAQRLDEAQQILRSRLTYAGTTLKFSNEEGDFWWWLMDSADANAARLILAVMDDPAWRDDLPRMVVGSLARQRNGAWLTTTANLWGSLALDKFSVKFESGPVSGKTVAVLAGGAATATRSIDWRAAAGGGSVTLPWPAGPAAQSVLNVTQEGEGKPWLTVQSLAAVPLKAPIRAGYAIARTVTAVERKDKSRWSRGDILRVRLEVDAQSDMTWVVVSDPVPGGATILGSGLGRDSAIATRGERREGSAWAAFEERSFEAFRSYFEYLPRGKHVVEYTVRFNTPGKFALPPTRVEAMYAPESFGEAPNAVVEVAP
ncbi:MAG: hypothetical protein AD742_06870 [Methylibium sp. NZG]|nr:MAG: hypothetical protein AD742_06870 [Methylibium sp. NZG]